MHRFFCNAADKLYRKFLIPGDFFLSSPSFVSNEFFLLLSGMLIFPFNREIGTTTELLILIEKFQVLTFRTTSIEWELLDAKHFH